MKDVRNDCLNLLDRILEKGQPSHLVLADYQVQAGETDAKDRRFTKKLVQGTVERKLTLDYIIDRVSKTPVAKMKPVVRNDIRMGVYQLLYMDVPDSAACNEAVKLIRKRGLNNLAGFVNGIMRSVSRQKDELTDFSGIEDPEERMSVMYSMPRWIVAYMLEHYGDKRTQKAFEYFLTDNLTSVRCNLSIASEKSIAESLEATGAEVVRTGTEGCLKISGYGALGELEVFKSGAITAQDLSSSLAGLQATICPEDKILDLCAAPGGKTLLAADRLRLAEREMLRDGDLRTKKGSAGYVVSCDVSESKTSLIEENVKRCGFDNIRILVNDATVIKPEFEDAFDIVLVDVPCSGLGIIGKKPDIKYNMTPERQHGLIGLQRAILDNAVRYVRRGGQLVFSTCTINSEENEDNVAYLESKGFEMLNMRQLLPGEEGADGFFYALLEKK